jgi:uncharacterized spore protein YtfJ
MMTDPEITVEAQQQAEASVAGPAAKVLERLAEKRGSKASVSAVFGEPVARAGITIIPVAKVGFGCGAGAVVAGLAAPRIVRRLLRYR